MSLMARAQGARLGAGHPTTSNPSKRLSEKNPTIVKEFKGGNEPL